MGVVGTPGASAPGIWWCLGLIAACFLLAAALVACGSEDSDAATNEKMLGLEAKVHSLEEALEASREENATLQRELIDLRQRQAAFFQEQDAAGIAEEIEQRKAADLAAGQAERLEGLEEKQDSLDERLTALEDEAGLAPETATAFDELETRLELLEMTAARIEGIFLLAERAFTDLDKRLTLLEGSGIERTLRLAAGGGGKAQVINYGAAYGGARSAVLVLPDPLPEGEIPLIVSLHGFGGNSYFQSQYVPLYERVNRDGFALLLPDGVENAEGQRFWNPTDGFGKADQDDVGALTALVQEAGGEFDMGPVYFFGYSNGGFMSYWMACQGLPGLRAVASLAGTSYVDDTACEGAAPVSVLHIHGTDDAVVRFEGISGETGAVRKDEPGYAGAQDMARRWGDRAGCDWPEDPQPYATLDLDAYVPGAETHVYRLESGCGDGISVELWIGEGSGHGPGYGDAFADALLDWLLAQE